MALPRWRIIMLSPAGNMRGQSISLSCSLAITNCGFFSQVRPGSPLIRKGCGGVGSLNLDCLVSGADMTCDNTRYSLCAPFKILEVCSSLNFVEMCHSRVQEPSVKRPGNRFFPHLLTPLIHVSIERHKGIYRLYSTMQCKIEGSGN